MDIIEPEVQAMTNEEIRGFVDFLENMQYPPKEIIAAETFCEKVYYKYNGDVETFDKYADTLRNLKMEVLFKFKENMETGQIRGFDFRTFGKTKYDKSKERFYTVYDVENWNINIHILKFNLKELVKKLT